MHMYATLSMGGATQSHKKVDATRSWVLYQYYTSKVSYHDAIRWWLHSTNKCFTTGCALHLLCPQRTIFHRPLSPLFLLAYPLPISPAAYP